MIARLILLQIALALATTTTAVASAQVRLSATKWAEDFAASLKAKDSKKISQLLSFEKYDQRFLNVCTDCADKVTMEKARKLYAKGQYDLARAEYDQVSKSSPYWIQAVEEKGWTYFRQNHLEATLAQSKTLLAPQFAGFVGSEAFFLQSLAQLKACNYKELFETHRLFKDKQKPRLAEIQDLAKTGLNEAFQKVLDETENFPLKFADIGENANHLPQLFFKDMELQRQLMRFKLAEKALAVMAAEGGPQGLQVKVANLKISSFALLKNRMKQLATQETNDNFKIVQKLNLLEVEAVQRLHADVEMDKGLFKKGSFGKTNSDQLVFLDDGRPWIDELDKYEVRVKACPQNIRRKM